MPQLARRARGRHLHGHAPLAQAVGEVAAPGPDEQRGGRPAVGGVEVVDAERQVGREPIDLAEVGAVLQRAAGTARASGSAAPGRTTHTGRPAGLAHRGADRLDRSRAAAVCHWPSMSNQPSSMPQASVVTRRGPCPRRSSTNSCERVGVDRVAGPLVEPGRRHDRRGEVGVRGDDHAVAGQGLEARRARRRRGRGRAGAARRRARGCPPAPAG